MKQNFESIEQFEALEAVVPAPWEVSSLKVWQNRKLIPYGVTFTYPVSANLGELAMLEDTSHELVPELATYFYPDEQENIFEVDSAKREHQEEGLQFILNVDMTWPLQKDVIEKLEIARDNIIVDTFFTKLLEQEAFRLDSSE